MTTSSRFHGKSVIVTGAGSGIGRSAARRFSAEGADVVVADVAQESIDAMVAELPPQRTLGVAVDVADPASVSAMVDATVERFGRIDVLVNNAGIHVVGDVMQTDLTDWRRIASIDIDGVVHCAKFAMPHLIRSRGSIINTSSVSGLGGDWGSAYYCAAKGAVTNLTRAMALDHGRAGVRVNAVCPGFVRTALTPDFAQEVLDAFLDRIPLGRVAHPDEVASVMAFLASEDAAYVNGVNLPVDGGTFASNGQPSLV